MRLQIKTTRYHYTVHLLEWLKPKTLIPPNAGKAMKQQELSFIADGNTKW